MMQKMFRVPEYNFRVYLTDLEHAKQIEELKDAGRELGGCVYWHRGKLCIYIATDHKGFGSKTLGEFVAHESIHCAWEILKVCGVVVEADNHEALAYLAEYVYNQVFKILKREKLANEKDCL